MWVSRDEVASKAKETHTQGKFFYICDFYLSFIWFDN